MPVNRFLAAALCSLLAQSAAHATFSLGLIGSGEKTSLSANNTFYSPNGYGFGGGLLFFVGGKNSGLEIGGIYQRRMLERTAQVSASTRANLVFELAGFDIPLLYRFALTNHFSLGLGGTYAHFSHIEVSARNVKNPNQGVSVSNTVSSSLIAATASLRLAVPSRSPVRVMIEARYNYGLTAKGRLMEPQIYAGLLIFGQNSRLTASNR